MRKSLTDTKLYDNRLLYWLLNYMVMKYDLWDRLQFRICKSIRHICNAILIYPILNKTGVDN
jgi:hypothetical protein